MIHATLDHIGSVFGGVNKPKLGQMREVASKMGQVYPALFQDETGGGYGLGGSRGNDGLANQMLDIFRGRSGFRGKTKGTDQDEDQSFQPAKGKRKYAYGECVLSL